MNVDADYMEDEAISQEEGGQLERYGVKLEPISNNNGRNFIDDPSSDNDNESDRGVKKRNMFYKDNNIPQLPSGMSKLQSIYEVLDNQKKMKKIDKEKKKINDNEKYLNSMMDMQYKLHEVIKRQNEKNKRLEMHLSNGIDVKNIGNNNSNNGGGDDDRYDPLDDVSYEDEQDIINNMYSSGKVKRKSKKKKYDSSNMMGNMLPMMLMIMNSNKNAGGSNKQEELFSIMSKQEEKIRDKLEDLKKNKQKDSLKNKNTILMNRLFNIEEHLINNINSRQNMRNNHVHNNINFTELMKAQQLYQQQLVDTLITINKSPKDVQQPTVYLPVPIRDPQMLPPIYDNDDIQDNSVRQSKEKKARKKRSVHEVDTHTKHVPTINIDPPHKDTHHHAAKMPIQPITNHTVMPISIIPHTQHQPVYNNSMIRVYKKKKDVHHTVNNPNKRSVKRLFNRIPPLRKYGYVVLFCIKYILAYKKKCMRIRKDSMIRFDENIERVYMKLVKIMRINTSEVLNKIWSISVPLSITRRKKLYIQYDIDQSTVSKLHWNTIYDLILELLETMNECMTEEYLDEDIISFIGRYISNESYHRDNYFYESMIDRLEYNRHMILMYVYA